MAADRGKASMASLHIRLLKGFEILRSPTEPIALPTRKARGLVALLARHPGVPRQREALASTLWFESGDRQARANLRQALKLVRRALGDHARTVVVSEGDAISLANCAVSVDVDRFECLIASKTTAVLERAEALYRGDFLEGLNLADGPFDEWCTIERACLREQAHDVFSRLMVLWRDAGKTERAIAMAQRLLALDPLQEGIHRQLIQFYLEQGRRSMALAQYWNCRKTVQSELGIGPEVETEHLFHKIQLQRHAPVASDASEADAEGASPMRSRRPQVDWLLTRPAVAVLRFAELDGDLTHTYFSDGLREDVITALAGWRRFPVIASSSTPRSRDDKRDTQDIARSLDARYVVDGSIRRSGTRMRVTARLIEADGGRCLWAEGFDFPFHDILSVQEETAHKIVGIVGPELECAELSRIRTKPPTDLTAWDYCLRGASLLKRSTRKGNADARSDFEQAVALDPEYSDAFTGLAYSYLRELLLVGPKDRSTIIEKGLEAARRAVVLDCNSSMAHLALATAQVWMEQFDLMIAETELAIDLNPSNAAARMALGNRLDLIGRTSEGIKEMEHSLRLNPRDPRRFTFMGFLSRAHVALANYEKALLWARRSVQLRADLPEPHFRLAVCLGHLERIEEAKDALNECERVKPGFVESYQGWRPYADTARNDHYFDGLRRHGLFK